MAGLGLLLSLQEWEILTLSLKVAFFAVLLGLPLAIFCAYLLVRVEFRGKIILDTLFHLPLVMPPVVTGYLLLITFGRQGWIGYYLDQIFDVQLAFRWAGAVIAALVMAFPLMLRPVRLSMSAINPEIEQAAAGLGASPLRRFFTITLPLCLPGILAAAVLGFAKSLGEFGATITFVSNIPGETQTLSLAIYSHIQTPGSHWPATRLVILGIVFSVAALMTSEWLQRRWYKK